MKLFFFSLLTFAGMNAFAQTGVNRCADAKVHEFDFWIGNWTVYKNGTDTIAGSNNITSIAGGCALLENWSSARSGFTGNSISKYSFEKKKWKQMWVDNSGLTLELEGEYAGNKMILSGGSKNQNGVQVWNRVTWFNNEDGTVRQLWEQSVDGRWSVVFDGLYRRK